MLRADRGARISVWRTVRTLAGLSPERGTTTELPKPGDDGVTGMVACDGSDGVLAALPMPLGLESVGLLAGPAGMPDIAELPAPAEPAGGVSCARDDAGENTTSKRAITTGPRSIEVSFREDQPTKADASSARIGWCRKQDSNL